MKQSINVQDALVEEWIRQGYGQGWAENYLPSLFVQDVPSDGEGWKVPVLYYPARKHPHQYLSFLEKSTGCILERQEVTQIREQYACLSARRTRDETIAIADDLGVRHPTYPGTRTPIIVTTDIVATRRDGSTLAVYCKPAELLDPATDVGRNNLAKLKIEEKYWSRRPKATFMVIDEHRYPDMLKVNVTDARCRLFQVEHRYLLPRAKEAIELFMATWTRFRTLFQILRQMAQTMGLNDVQVAYLVYGAVWRDQIPVDLGAARLHPRYTVRMR